MSIRLFVYGTLAPGRPNQHVLAKIEGHWQPARVKGRLEQSGWGAELGYPGLVLDDGAGEVSGLLFTAEGLAEQWPMLDEFEGSGYKRCVTQATLACGEEVECYVYTLSQP